MVAILIEPPRKLPNGHNYSSKLQNLINWCLEKKQIKRPTIKQLFMHEIFPDLIKKKY